MAQFKLYLLTSNDNYYDAAGNLQQMEFTKTLISSFKNQEQLYEYNKNNTDKPQENICYTYNEKFSLHANSQKDLTFSMSRNVFKSNGEIYSGSLESNPAAILNPFADKLFVGTTLLLEDKYGNETFFTITNVSYKFGALNIIYNYTCQDSFTYQLSRQQNGYSITNDYTSDNYIGVKTVDDWVIDYIDPECHIPYKYIKANEGIYENNNGEIIIVSKTSDITNNKKLYKPIYGDNWNENWKDYYDEICFEISNSSAKNALISLGEKLDLNIRVLEKLQNNLLIRYYWFEPAKNPIPSEIKYSPTNTIKELSLSGSGDSLATICNVSTVEVNDEEIGLFPTVPKFFIQYFENSQWDKTSYSTDFYKQAFEYSFNISRNMSSTNIKTFNNHTYYCTSDIKSELIAQIKPYYESLKLDSIKIGETKQTKTCSLLLQDSNDVLIMIDLSSKENFKNFINFDFSDYEIFLASTTIFTANTYIFTLKFWHDETEAETNFAEIADTCPWLENKLIDLSYFKDRNIITSDEYNKIMSELCNNLRIINGHLMFNANAYYAAVEKKVTAMSTIQNNADELGAVANELINNYRIYGTLGNSWTDFKDKYDKMVLDFNCSIDNKTVILDYSNLVSSYFRKYFDNTQLFLENIKEFRDYFNTTSSLSGTIYKYTISTNATLSTNAFLGFESSRNFTSAASESGSTVVLNPLLYDENQNRLCFDIYFRESANNYNYYPIITLDTYKNAYTRKHSTTTLEVAPNEVEEEYDPTNYLYVISDTYYEQYLSGTAYESDNTEETLSYTSGGTTTLYHSLNEKQIKYLSTILQKTAKNVYVREDIDSEYSFIKLNSVRKKLYGDNIYKEINYSNITGSTFTNKTEFLQKIANKEAVSFADYYNGFDFKGYIENFPISECYYYENKESEEFYNYFNHIPMRYIEDARIEKNDNSMIVMNHVTNITSSKFYTWDNVKYYGINIADYGFTYKQEAEFFNNEINAELLSNRWDFQNYVKYDLFRKEAGYDVVQIVDYYGEIFDTVFNNNYFPNNIPYPFITMRSIYFEEQDIIDFCENTESWKTFNNYYWNLVLTYNTFNDSTLYPEADKFFVKDIKYRVVKAGEKLNPKETYYFLPWGVGQNIQQEVSTINFKTIFWSMVNNMEEYIHTGSVEYNTTEGANTIWKPRVIRLDDFNCFSAITYYPLFAGDGKVIKMTFKAGLIQPIGIDDFLNNVDYNPKTSDYTFSSYQQLTGEEESWDDDTDKTETKKWAYTIGFDKTNNAYNIFTIIHKDEGFTRHGLDEDVYLGTDYQNKKWSKQATAEQFYSATNEKFISLASLDNEGIPFENGVILRVPYVDNYVWVQGNQLNDITTYEDLDSHIWMYPTNLKSVDDNSIDTHEYAPDSATFLNATTSAYTISQLNEDHADIISCLYYLNFKQYLSDITLNDSQTDFTTMLYYYKKVNNSYQIEQTALNRIVFEDDETSCNISYTDENTGNIITTTFTKQPISLLTLSNTTNGMLWYLFRDKEDSDDLSMLWQESVNIETTLSNYWKQAYNASLQSQFFVPENWQINLEENNNKEQYFKVVEPIKVSEFNFFQNSYFSSHPVNYVNKTNFMKAAGYYLNNMSFTSGPSYFKVFNNKIYFTSAQQFTLNFKNNLTFDEAYLVFRIASFNNLLHTSGSIAITYGSVTHTYSYTWSNNKWKLTIDGLEKSFLTKEVRLLIDTNQSCSITINNLTLSSFVINYAKDFVVDMSINNTYVPEVELLSQGPQYIPFYNKETSLSTQNKNIKLPQIISSCLEHFGSNQEWLNNWTCQSGTVFKKYYKVSTGGIMWENIFNLLDPTAPANMKYFDGNYGMQLNNLMNLYKPYSSDDNAETKYKKSLEDNNNFWYSLHLRYPFLLLETNYSNTELYATEAKPINQIYLNLAQTYFKDLSEPEYNYNISLIDYVDLKGYKGEELHFGDSIRIDAEKYINNTNTDIYKALQQYLFITDISYDLRKDSSLSLTVNKVKQQDKIMKILASVINKNK